jgi:hypothetical protein
MYTRTITILSLTILLYLNFSAQICNANEVEIQNIKLYKIVQIDTSQRKIENEFLIALYDSRFYFFDLNPFYYNYKCGCESKETLNFINENINKNKIDSIITKLDKLKLVNFKNYKFGKKKANRKLYKELLKSEIEEFTNSSYTYGIAVLSIKAKFLKVNCKRKSEYLKKYNPKYFPSTVLQIDTENSIIILDI